jgi:hypothetical protein
MPIRLNRRRALQTGAAASVASMLGLRARAQQQSDPRFLFVVAASGGGSILDSLLPVLDSESANGSTLTTYPGLFVAQPSGSNLRCVHSDFALDLGGLALPQGRQRGFLERHAADTCVMTVEGTSVNHLVAAKRAVNGAGADRGRTLMEAMAVGHGQDLLLPNCNMGESGYLEPGDDPTVPAWARAETIADAALFPVATDGVRGVEDAPARSLVNRARRVREQLENRSVFARTFRAAPVLQRYLDTRRTTVPAMEMADLITKLMMVPNIDGQIPLNEYGLESSPEADRVLTAFPDLLNDPFEAQAALAFLLTRYGISCAVTLSPSFAPIVNSTIENTPLAFDFSHTLHTFAQYAMWSRVLGVAGRLIDLLKEQDLDDEDPGRGKMWDKSLVYFATEFGRDKTRPADSFEFGTGHHLNNGAILCSPLLMGNQVFGGVDTSTALTYGFDRVTGADAPGTVMREQDVYSVICSAMNLSYEGQVELPCMLRDA